MTENSDDTPKLDASELAAQRLLALWKTSKKEPASPSLAEKLEVLRSGKRLTDLDGPGIFINSGLNGLFGPG